MARTPWHPYAADQAFGQQAARDQELVDQIIDRLDASNRTSPRAGNKAPAPGHQTVSGPASSWLLAWTSPAWDGPVTTAAALEAAALLRE